MKIDRKNIEVLKPLLHRYRILNCSCENTIYTINEKKYEGISSKIYRCLLRRMQLAIFLWQYQLLMTNLRIRFFLLLDSTQINMLKHLIHSKSISMSR